MTAAQEPNPQTRNFAEILEAARRPLEPMTEEELQTVYERCAKATPGLWFAGNVHPVWGKIERPICQMGADASILVGQSGDFGPLYDPVDDAEFIAHARLDIPRLLREVHRLRIIIRRWVEGGAVRAA